MTDYIIMRISVNKINLNMLFYERFFKNCDDINEKFNDINVKSHELNV